MLALLIKLINKEIAGKSREECEERSNERFNSFEQRVFPVWDQY